ncbi:hypothetical protein CHGG_04073 [Chaetomium globosum CBS 148.51]|uniref:Uncharacterized protein n=1 Tax=Chaetomium globosum (strain ATCC 6205 / CBS 148.51 / DSM 1962 / NBRC 6347 / NRRL 1970) TaxID=306901 RepID=Q2H2C3_CHAGB|nr:uncharacterized protein CHGG_04073 [Chaetomium globosum CBS 148.51]EAQ87454.1 hypothetical protein CHGG_04073 [Chaetomium globosum CBS 148.51]
MPVAKIDSDLVTFRDAHGEEQDVCRLCTAQFDPASSVTSLSSLGSLPDMLSSSNPFSTPTTPSQMPPLRRGPIGRRGSVQSAASSPSQSQSQLQLPAVEPVPDQVFDGDLSADAITMEDRVRLQKFNAEMAKEAMIEEQLIARVHVHVEVFLYRGQQYKYRGHVVNFLRDVGEAYNQLPRLPRELDVIVLRPANFAQQDHVIRQFRRRFFVKQSNIRQWLAFLKANHPAYRDIVISEERLSQLPEDGGSVMDEFPVEDVDPVDIEDVVAEANDESHLINAQQQSQHPGQPPTQPYIEMGEIRRTPLNEFNRSQPLLSWAFPTLFPYGRAEFVAPRVRSITYREYLYHAMRNRDRRFARHPRFRFHADTLRGTRAYWTGKGHQLTAHVYALGMPAMFMTFSPADLHWDSLARHMPRYDEWKQGTERARQHISWQNLQDNPHIAAYHFFKRYNAFRDYVLIPKFGIVDYWGRFEWQARGSSHHHGLYWCAGSVQPDLEDDEGRTEFARRWGFSITAMNPEPNRVMMQGKANVLIIELFEHEQPTFDTLSRIVNRVQRHAYSEAYCLRRKKLPGGVLSIEPVCRFYFPRRHHEEAYVTRDMNPAY